ncbi:type IV secretion system protein TraC [Noviherbaspirillum sp. CPCC 100848]|uniref:Type IV secretion system protein TraC n=1 Tax=Noviherbaspirillum album TaxID=3080276 RepID=A0ABU6J3L7_9BURK|nr:type IV secretion system protein TraC [Noviherbaspirillum sp. CPCC 100848]MEC4718204.1 type IV secretion system protein TraC [Noviherbaspirillum sp. CPCC 100848]
MSIRSRIAEMLKRERIEADFPILAHDLDNDLMLLEGAGKVSGYLGAMLYGFPVVGLDETTLDRLKGALSNDIPAGAFIQISLLSTPDIDDFVHAYQQSRDIPSLDYLSPEQKALLSAMVDNRSELYRSGKEEPLVAASGVKCNSTTVLVSIKVPLKEHLPREREMKDTSALVSKISESMATFGLRLERANASKYLATLRRIMHMHEPVTSDYDENALLRDQIMGAGDRVELDKKSIRANDTHIGVLSVRRLPKHARLSMMNQFIGDPRGLGNQITEPYMMTLTLHYPDQAKKAAAIRRKAQVINYQAYGPMLRWVPRLAYKKHGFDVMLHTMEEGAVLVEMNFSLTLFARDEEALSRLMSATRTYYGSFGLEMAEDQYVCWPVFYNTLPLFPSEESISLSHRFHTMAVKHAVNFAPILSEWRGTGNGAAMMLLSRRGQPVLFDLYDSDTNYNGIIFAEAGGGKSFLTQALIMDYLSKGAKIWVVDVGRSYYKLCKAVGGEFISFNSDSQVCLNPFTEVVDIDEDLDVLKAVLAKMAAPTGSLDDHLLGRLEEAIKATWSRKANMMTVTDVADYLKNQKDEDVVRLGDMLYPFTRHGGYGSWFDGTNNLNFGSNLVVLELEELNSKRALQQVVLLQLISKIQHEMFVEESSGGKLPRIVIIDEAWDLLNDNGGGVSRFIEAGYRRFRKYNGAAVVVTQSINDLYGNASGRAIAENTAHMFMLQMRGESIDDAKASKRVGIGDYGFTMLRSVHTVPGKYSEVMLYTRAGWGIVRLVVDRFTQVLFSTKGAERNEVMDAIERGVPTVDAINRFIERNG